MEIPGFCPAAMLLSIVGEIGLISQSDRQTDRQTGRQAGRQNDYYVALLLVGLSICL